MKKKTSAIIWLFGLLIVTATSEIAQKRAQDQPAGLLFEISGNGLPRPSYIFGTFHILCPKDMFPMEKFSSFIDQADQLVMEVDMDDPTEMAAMTKGIANSDGRTVKDVLSAEQFAKVDEMFKNTVGYSIENVKMLKPALLTVLIITSQKMLGCSPPSSYDLSLVKIAAEKKKPIVGLETVAFQSRTLESKSLEKQAKDLYEMSLDPQKSVDELKRMIEVYKSQDIEKLRTATEKQEKDDADFEKHLIDDRNAAWIPKIETFIREKSTFIAVGAGHLGGDKGVIRLLQKKGYNVKVIGL